MPAAVSWVVRCEVLDVLFDRFFFRAVEREAVDRGLTDERFTGGEGIDLEDLRERCIMTTVDPDTNAGDVEVLQDIRRRFGGKLCLNARVVRAATVAVGDPVELLATSSSAEARSGPTPP